MSCPWAHEALKVKSVGYKHCLRTVTKTSFNEDLQMTFDVRRHTTLIVNNLFKTSIFQRIGKKNNQSSVSDADREISTLGPTDNAGNSVNLVSSIIRLPSGWDFLLSYDVAVIQWITSCHENRMTTRVITLWRVHVTSLTTSVSTILFILKVIKSRLKGHVISYEIYETRQRLVS